MKDKAISGMILLIEAFAFSFLYGFTYASVYSILVALVLMIISSILFILLTIYLLINAKKTRVILIAFIALDVALHIQIWIFAIQDLFNPPLCYTCP